MAEIKTLATCKEIDDYLDYYDGLLVACFWKEPDLYKDYEGDIHFNRFLDDTKNPDNSLISTNRWRVIYNIGESLILDEHVINLDEVTVNNYLLKHKKLKKQWESISSNTFENLKILSDNIDTNNLESYISSIKKYRAIQKMEKNFHMVITEKQLSQINNFKINDLFDIYEEKLQSAFIDRDEGVNTAHLMDNVEENMAHWQEGSAMGLPFYNLPHYTTFTGGMPKGGITLVGGVSNVGKSSFLRTVIFPSLFLTPTHEVEKTIIFLNEEDLDKWQREFITWVANNIYTDHHIHFTKNILRNGNFEKEKPIFDVIKESIKVAKEVLGKNEDDILFIPLPKFSTNIVLKQMKRYCALGYQNFIIDTFKMDNTDDARIDNNTRLQLIQNMTKIYNLCKPTVKDLRVICTIQLSKASTYKRILSQDDLAESKNIIDVCSSGFFMRPVWENEKNEKDDNGIRNPYWLEVKDFANQTVLLDKLKKYLLLFTVKNREGEAGVGSKVFVVEVDWATNTLTEIGTTIVKNENIPLK